MVVAEFCLDEGVAANVQTACEGITAVESRASFGYRRASALPENNRGREQVPDEAPVVSRFNREATGLDS